MAIQADGKIVVAGSSRRNFALARYNSNGSLDTSFDGDGKLTTDFGGWDEASSMAIQADGKIVVAGSSRDNFALARYNSNGSLDTSFDGDGKLTIDFGGIDMAHSMAIQADGKIVVAGESGGNFALVRLNNLLEFVGTERNDNFLGSLGNDFLSGKGGTDILSGQVGNDTLDGGTGNDRLNGGSGNDLLTGGTGSDTFILNVNGKDIVQDFNRAENDKIDLTAVAAKGIKLVTSGTNTIIKAKENVNGAFKDIAVIKNNTTIDSAIDTGDLIFVSESEKQALFPQLTTPITNISGLIKDWCDRFASSKGLTIQGNINLAGVSFQLIDIDWDSQPIIPQNDFILKRERWRNGLTGSVDISVTQNNQNTFENSIQASSQLSFGQTNGVTRDYSFSKTTSKQFSWNNSTKLSFFAKIKDIFNLGAENTTDIGRQRTTKKTTTFNISNNLEKTFGEVLSYSRSTSETITQGQKIQTNYQVKPESVVYLNHLTWTGNVTMDLAIKYRSSGNFSFILSNGKTYSVPINAILQQYDLQNGKLDTYKTSQQSSILGTDFDGNNTYMYYNDLVDFTLTAAVQGTVNFSQAEIVSVTDVVLSESRSNNTNVQQGIEVIKDPLGNTTQIKYTASSDRERIWITSNSFESHLKADEVRGFIPGQDLIGILHPNIIGFDNLYIDYQTSPGNADIYYNDGIGTNPQDRHLARFFGIDPNSLTASNFKFDTVNSVFDNTIPVLG